MPLDRLQSGDLNVTRQNQIIDQVNALSRPGAMGQAQYGTGGMSFHAPPEPHLALFELTGAMTFPDLEGAAADCLDRDPTPFAPARRLWCHRHASADQTSAGQPVRSYGGLEHSRDEILWHPSAWRNGDGHACGMPEFNAGDRVWCHWNRQSGRWEILLPPLRVWRVELQETFMPGDSEAGVVLVDDAAGLPIIVHAPPSQALGVGRAGGTRADGSARAGTTAYAIWNAVRRRWEFLAGSFKHVAEGKAAEAIAAGASGLVDLWWLDDATGQLAASGQQVSALNWLHPPIQAGKKVIMSLDRQEQRWTVVAAEG